MTRIGRCVTTLACSALLALGAWSAAAQDASDDGEPPPRAGRISVIEGRMTFKNPDDADWSDAEINYPIGPGQSFATAPGTRGEFELGGTTLRLDGRTTLTMLSLDDASTTARIEDGTVAVHVSMIFDGEAVELETPDGRVTFAEPGSYRVDAGVGTLPTRVVAFSGRAEIETARGRQNIPGGSAYDVNDAGQVRPASTEVTSIDDWSRSRDRIIATSTSNRYVSDGTPGYQDLDTNGAWQDTVEYGQVWYPSSVPNDWAPYTIGNWVWVSPWGWTWVDAQPWGFAPFHYGRWAYIGGRWGWSPGERIRRRPVFAPAVVGFGLTDGRRFRSRHDRPTQWVPLAPGETFRPWYTRNANYARNLNRGNIGRGGISITINNSDRPNFANARPFDENRGRWARGNDRFNDRGPDRSPGRDNDPRWRNDGNRIVITDPPRTTPQAPGQPVVQQPQDNGRGGRQWTGRDFRRPNGGQNNGQNGGAPLLIAPTLQSPNAVTPPPNPVTPAPQLGAPSFATPESDAARMERRNRWRGGDGNDGNGRGGRPRPPQTQQTDPNASLPRFRPGLRDQSAETLLHRDRALQQPPTIQNNLGQNNLGQNNLGQWNVGQDNAGQGSVGQPNVNGDPIAQPPGGGGRGQGRGGFGRERNNN